jgi:Fanconi anemia group M protein
MKTIYTKQIHNIFSNPKKTKIKNIPKQKIIIDYREKNSLVISELIASNFEIEIQELKVADYITNNVAIERKTISDFVSSMINKRLIKQLEELQQYEKKLLIIEGIEEKELYSENSTMHPNSIRGFLLSICLKYKIPIIFSKNYQDTAKYISLIAKKKQKESSLNVTKKTLNKKERMQFILESFPGIGPSTAKKLLQKFKNLKNIFNLPNKKIQEVIGKKAEIFKIIEENYL